MFGEEEEEVFDDIVKDEDYDEEVEEFVELVKKVKGKRGRKCGGRKENEIGYKIIV